MMLIVPGTDGGARRARVRSIRSMQRAGGGSIMRSWMQTVVASFIVGALIVAPACALAVDKDTEERFETQVKTALAPLAGKAVADVEILYLGADVRPWIDTGVELQAGDKVSWILEGRSWRSRAQDRWLKPSQVVWGRIGTDGPILHGTRDTFTFTAAKAGSLQLRHWNGLWQDERGALVDGSSPIDPDAGGVIRVALIRWSPGVDPAQEFRRLTERADAPDWAAAELARQREVVEPLAPAGWRILGFAEMFRELRDGARDAPQPRIALHTRNDIAVLQKDVAKEFAPGTTLRWKWKLDRLPSRSAENAVFTHDYISIAVKFDNGQDLTYFWSSGLPVGASFRCPFPTWATRETHLVARSGSGDLGKWLRESRDVFEDYRKAVGGELPKRITQIWLIGASVMGRSEGLGEFGEIAIGSDKEIVSVY